ncbi:MULTISPECIES: hypothetical protein [unclassified Endozoicomonas]|uniref:hypothetical protein n=1 Tax=unclassified Endozoicomonas TaxID=2644528 RepID=UPI00214953EA|nr:MULTISPECIES: hypothetical protein [unclassified Endozoicomonas]
MVNSLLKGCAVDDGAADEMTDGDTEVVEVRVTEVAFNALVDGCADVDGIANETSGGDTGLGEVRAKVAVFLTGWLVFRY